MNERRFYIDTASDPWRQMVVEADGTSHEADPGDPDLVARRTRDDDFPDSLDAAWAEAEAALPEGWYITNAALDGAGGWYVVANPTPADAMRATGAHGRTFAAALRALAAKLREREA